MAVKKKRRSHRHKSDDKKRHHELSARLAPLEETKEFRRSEQHDGGGDGAGTIRVGSKSVKMPEQLLAEERDAADTFRPHPIVVVILLVAIAFIAFIAWQITLMPPPAK